MKYNLNKELRIERIKEYILDNKEASIEELCQMCNVSAMTIHRDLDEISGRGSIIKVRGGARLEQTVSEHLFAEREAEHSNEKAIIGGKMAARLEAGAAIFFDAGTTTMAVASQMPEIDASIFTVAPNIALELVNTTKPSITLCPGNLDRKNLMLYGYFTLDMLNQINIDVAVIGTSGYSDACGFSCGVESQMIVKRQAIRRAKRVYMLMDSSKYGKDFPFTFAGLEDVDYIVMECEPPEDLRAAAEASGVIIL